MLLVNPAVRRNIDHRIPKNPARTPQAPTPPQYIFIADLLYLGRGRQMLRAGVNAVFRKFPDTVYDLAALA